MKKLSNAGKSVARRSFAAFMAALLCVTGLSTNFFGLGTDSSQSITGGFEAFAADDAVSFGRNETYYDAGTLNMNAYYDGTTGQKLDAVSENYHATNWDVVKAESYMARVEQNGHTGVTVLSTTDIAAVGKIGTSTQYGDDDEGKNGIMCFSEYLGQLNEGKKAGDDGYVAYEKTVPDYEAPAGIESVTYQYIAKGDTSEDKERGGYKIEWTLFAWPQEQNSVNKEDLDTNEELKTNWEKIVKDSESIGTPGLVLPGKMEDKRATFSASGIKDAIQVKNFSENSDSIFKKGEPKWYSGNQDAFDLWDADNSEHYLRNMGLWSRIETNAVTLNVSSTGIEAVGTPGVFIDFFAPNNRGTGKGQGTVGGGTSFTLTENGGNSTRADTENMPLYTQFGNYGGTGSNKLSNLTLKDAITAASGSSAGTDVTNLTLPTYNIRKMLYNMWETEQYAYFRKAASFTVWNKKDAKDAEREHGADPKDDTYKGTTYKSADTTGVRLYGIESTVRVNTKWIDDHKTNDPLLSYLKGDKTVTKTDDTEFVSAYQKGKAYGGNKDTNCLTFVFNENDANSTKNIYHIDDLPENVMNLSDIYSSYEKESLLKSSSGTDVPVIEDISNIFVPFLIRSDAYYDITSDYQRAAGQLVGYADAPTLTTSAINTVSGGRIAHPSEEDTIVDTVTYTGLEGGQTYTLKGTLYSVSSELLVNTVNATTTFVAKKNGTAEVTFNFDSDSTLNVIEGTNKAFVVYEELYKGDTAAGTVIAEHKDPKDPLQTILYTTAPYVNTHASLSPDGTSIIDTMDHHGFDPDDDDDPKTYTVVTQLFDKTTSDMVPGIEKVSAFTLPEPEAEPDENEIGSTEESTETEPVWTVTISPEDGLNMDALQGHTVVVYETIKDAEGKVVAVHTDANDELQTVQIGPSSNIATLATSATGSKYLDAVDSEMIIDNVTVSSLRANTNYTARATLYDITAGDFITDSANGILAWSEPFRTNIDGNSSVAVRIGNFNASDKAGHAIVVYEDILDPTGAVVATHADNSDEDQIVNVNTAGIVTVLGNKDGSKAVSSSDNMSVSDAITYSGLVPGNRYYMVSTLIDKETGEVLKDSSGNEAVVISTVFTANTTGSNKGSSSFTFTNMAAKLTGRTIVAFNDLYKVTDDTPAGEAITDSVKAELLASENDPENKDQTVIVDSDEVIEIHEASIDTVAKGSDGSKQIPLATNSVIKDTVTYAGLDAGKTYTLYADVYDTTSGKRAAGYEKETTMDFTADDDGEGETVMTIDIDTTELSGHRLVVYETLKSGSTTVAEHRDLTDEDQAVTVNDTFQASIDTVATDKATGGKTLMADSSASILDKVSYDGLDPKQTYKLITTVYDKTTGSQASNIDTVTTEFKPEQSNGEIEVTIPVDGTAYTAGQSLVVYEELVAVSKTSSSSSSSSSSKSSSSDSNTVTVASHKDISDADQTVTFVKMTTFLTGDGSSSKTVHVGSDAYVIDTASFTGLTPNRTYSITTQLIDSAAGSPAVTLDTDSSQTSSASGQSVASRTMEFTPTTANGSIAVQVNVDTTGLQGHSLVAVATVTDKTSGAVVATHTDTSNVDQTIGVQTRVEAQTGVGSRAWIFSLIAAVAFSLIASYGIGVLSDKKRGKEE